MCVMCVCVHACVACMYAYVVDCLSENQPCWHLTILQSEKTSLMPAMHLHRYWPCSFSRTIHSYLYYNGNISLILVAFDRNASILDQHRYGVDDGNGYRKETK